MSLVAARMHARESGEMPLQAAAPLPPPPPAAHHYLLADHGTPIALLEKQSPNINYNLRYPLYAINSLRAAQRSAAAHPACAGQQRGQQCMAAQHGGRLARQAHGHKQAV